ncbi:hypothetical protein [Devosia sp.]|uniref:hypothetical protein n=1 Tax=Devosia sp. TaxID=1871048 RepID=UPI003A913B33
MRTLLISVLTALTLAASPALAQFPPPGIYQCTDTSGTMVGELTLLVAGDYSFADPEGKTGNGQVASAGSDVDPLSGPLADRQLYGSFETGADGATVFVFTGPEDLTVTCR